VLFVTRAPGSAVRVTLRTYAVPNVTRRGADGIRVTKCTLTALPSRGSESRASVGKSCIRFKPLDDLDEAEFRDLLAEAGRRPAPGAV
jgi:hypothetical protein